MLRAKTLTLLILMVVSSPRTSHIGIRHSCRDRHQSFMKLFVLLTRYSIKKFERLSVELQQLHSITLTQLCLLTNNICHRKTCNELINETAGGID
jgi:hypothetical protein